MIATEDAANSSDEDLKRLAEVINYTASGLKRDSYKDPKGMLALKMKVVLILNGTLGTETTKHLKVLISVISDKQLLMPA